ncbi:uncharacterized protein LOC100575978 [Acyrthosiphon pisum]|uniref:Uncharacterized protein n=1 Tax=Acyrthosiphon pisum TaxID=7029 RepID=A0A8R1W9N0_ACYPI|nr:uncharacterized protein LOC100575978 [Acyrthosiphon pisum]|eukprot:XP_003246437.1 PREDICTED: uncharacterized protein LOC100575978 [Acyrthosiphon pisum]
MNDTQEKYILNVDVPNVYKTVQKYAENHENSIECIENFKMLDYISDGKISNISVVSDNFNDVQRQEAAQSNIEGGGELSSNHEKNTQLETIENDSEGLNIKNEFIVDKVQIVADRNKLINDQITTIKAEINELQNEMKITQDGEIIKELDNAAYFKAIVDKIAEIHGHIDQFTVIVKGLKLTLQDACVNKETITEIMEVSEYLRAHYAIQVTETQRNFTEQINKHETEINQLKSYADNKNKEVDTLKKRTRDQKLLIDSYEKSMKCITDELSNVSSYIKQRQNENDQLSAPNEKQKDFFLLLVEKLEEIDEL